MRRARRGERRASSAHASLAGAALASPVLANGRLISVAADGTIEGLLSGTNLAPETPVLNETARPLDAGDVTLRWLAVQDADGETPSYELRIDADGEVLSDWQQQIFLGAGVTSTEITATLTAGVTYTSRCGPATDTARCRAGRRPRRSRSRSSRRSRWATCRSPACGRRWTRPSRVT